MALQNVQSNPAPAVTGPAQNKMSTRRWWRDIGWRYIVAVVAVVYAAFPIVYVLSASFASKGTLSGSNSLFGSISTVNYAALNDTMFWSWVRNTMVIGTATAIGTMPMGAAATYAFSRFRFTGRRFGLTALLVIQMFPQLLAFVAVFLLLLALGDAVPVLGLNSQLGLIMVYLGGALGVNTFLMYGFFNTVPRELDEAAKIDGASQTQIFWIIILRLVAPILAVVALLSFISTFSDFLLAKLILQDEKNWTLAVGLYQWVSDRLSANWGIFAAGAVISAIPVMLLFLFLQKYIVSGLTAGSVKG